MRRILLVEDNHRDLRLTLSAFQEHQLCAEIDIARDGEEALDYVYRRGAFSDRPHGDPAVILLDIKLPKVDGLEVLRALRTDPWHRRTPVVMLTSSCEDPDLQAAYDLGVNAYIVKPVDYVTLSRVLGLVGELWTRFNQPPPLISSSQE